MNIIQKNGVVSWVKTEGCIKHSTIYIVWKLIRRLPTDNLDIKFPHHLAPRGPALPLDCLHTVHCLWSWPHWSSACFRCLHTWWQAGRCYLDLIPASQGHNSMTVACGCLHLGYPASAHRHMGLDEIISVQDKAESGISSVQVHWEISDHLILRQQTLKI